ncbi:MJ0042-type zinc finger domain-containing protein [Brevundimonas variabilis]|uniref:Putative Zn finger-like uncharacterized protein n=1 Tax=Brevundimonas variabilis TaxID=74312 RepID=A0A7W9CGD1_9CAUL|nr:MJ0042-type zinc finger domain-containing protein [Brevundimonas variabilis]MBB5745130.1 putative Zn finger-like uncharacterized protein [Brevundimonas variabilis]
MILTCPSCATSYFTPDEAVGANGRRVRCQSCAHVWHATHDAPLELTSAVPVPAPPTPAPDPAPAQAGFGKRDEADADLSETPAPELPKAFRARAEQQRRLRRAATHGAVWAGLASVFIGLIAAAWLFRIEIVDFFPRAGAAYAAVGLPVNPTGLEFEAISAKTSPNAPDQVLVSGALRNVRDREVVSPSVRLALLDDHGAEIGFKIVAIDSAPVLPGSVQGFAALIPDPGGHAAGVGVDFVTGDTPSGEHAGKAEGAKAHGNDHGEEPHSSAPAATAGHAADGHATPAVRRPPQPEAHDVPMRSALAPIGAADGHATPIEARPVADDHASTLDKAHAGPVSAGHG